MGIDDTTSEKKPFKPAQDAQRPGEILGFASIAEQLRELFQIKKTAVRKAKKSNHSEGDLTPFVRLRNGQRVPGWSEIMLQDRGAIWVNKNRQEIKDYVYTLLYQLGNRKVEIEPERLIETVNELLVTAEYSPLNAERNEDDKRLLKRLREVCKPDYKRGVPVQPPDPLEQELGAILDQLLKLASRNTTRSQNKQVISGQTVTDGPAGVNEKADFIIFKAGVAETERYQSVVRAEKENAGTRLYYAPYLATFTLPQSVRQEYTRVNRITGSANDRYFQARKERLDNWVNQLKAGHRHRDIYEQEGIDAWFKNRLFQGVLMSPAELKEQIETLCFYMKEYDRAFTVAISPYRLNFNFEVKAEKVVLLQARRDYPADRYEGLLHIRLEGSRHVEYFSNLFERIWEKCSIKGYEQVENWLWERYNTFYSQVPEI
jgi:hypothetical protein